MPRAAAAYIREREFSGQQRAAYIVRLILVDGLLYRTCDIAHLFGMSWHGADKLMDKIAEPAGLYKTKWGYWMKEADM